MNESSARVTLDVRTLSGHSQVSIPLQFGRNDSSPLIALLNVTLVGSRSLWLMGVEGTGQFASNAKTPSLY
ncbi:hypothetical protein [Herbiconiux ginsengi]|uniref:Uncharacterized protein n=1 Tax=Herbiconiux ginsengi TaxID=381665 RepID=A0A1H3PZH3_9MICO|nr:hypothetical protein [Herbiconiux ginsengi]SDZ06363.1 hypothetical protein SAMN05216554_2200 [Herbiconiux ginsengi]